MSPCNAKPIFNDIRLILLNPRLPEPLFVTCLPKGVVTILSLDFAVKSPILMTLVLEAR